MERITDMHCHILPGLDDGAGDMDETMAVLHEAAEQQIRYMIVTPHFHPGRYMASSSQVLNTLAAVQRRCSRCNLNISLFAGQECYYYSELTQQLERGNALTLAGSRYVLVEFEPDCRYTYLLGGIQKLQQAGYKPILAHFERYACLRDHENLLRLKERGCLLQMNFDMILQKNGFLRKNPWRNLIKQGMVDFLGSDCHGMDFRPLHVQEACSWLERNVESSLLEQMLYRNIENILKNG